MPNLHLIALWILRLGAGEHALRISDTHNLALLHALERQRSNQGSAHTRTVFSRKDLDWVMASTKWLAVAALLPVEDLLESLCAALLYSRQ